LDHAPSPGESPKSKPTATNTLLENRELAEREIIQSALVSNHYNRLRAANVLGVSRVTLYKKIKKYGLMDISVRIGRS
jgi:DNA-binding NtrC family response regulator